MASSPAERRRRPADWSGTRSASGPAILTEASLSFLRLGVPPPALSLGADMLREGYSYLLLAPWISIASGAAIFAVVLAFQLLADGASGRPGPASR